MVKRRVLHGDLSPNNFIIHDGQGYYIDFDHAGIILDGSECIRSHGTVSDAQIINGATHG
jgi:hypothetical protein